MVAYIDNMNKKNLLLIFLILIGVGVGARIWLFGGIPASLYWDEVAIGLDARSLLQTGKDLNNHHWFQTLFRSYGDYKAPVYIWLVTLLGKIFSVNEVIIRLPSLLSSFLTAWLLFRLVKLTAAKNSFLPFLVTVSYLIMPWSIHFSRIGMESHLSLFWLVLSVYLMVVAAKKNQPVKIIVSAMAICVGIYTYITLRVLALPFFITGFLIYHFPRLKKHLWAFLVGLGMIIVSILILTRSPDYQISQQYRLSNDNLITSTSYIDQSSPIIEDSGNTLIARVFQHRYIYKTREYLVNYFSHFSPQFLFVTGDDNLRHHSGFGGQLLLIQGLFLFLGCLSLAKYRNKESLLIISWLLLSPVVSALVNESPHASRAIYMIIPLSWLIGLGIDWLFKHTCKSTKSIVALICFGLLLINLTVYLHDYFKHYPERSAAAWLVPYKQAAIYYVDHPTDKPVYVTDQWYQPGLYFAFYQNIDTMTLQQNRSNYLDNLGNFTFSLPVQKCPSDSFCVVSPDWQPDTSEIINEIPGTDQLVIKQSYVEENN